MPTAAQYASRLLASMTREPHPNDPVLRATYKRQIVDRLAGIEISVLERMISAKDGLVARLVHPPAIGEITDWLEMARAPMFRRIDLQLDEIKRLEQEAEPEVPEEERRRNLQMLKDVSQLIKDTAKATKRASPPLPAWVATEEEAKEGRVKALEYNDAMRKVG
jgi:hypothetical protein